MHGCDTLGKLAFGVGRPGVTLVDAEFNTFSQNVLGAKLLVKEPAGGSQLYVMEAWRRCGIALACVDMITWECHERCRGSSNIYAMNLLRLCKAYGTANLTC